MRSIILISMVAIFALYPDTGVGHTFTGRVERIIDGDTIIVGTNRVRLAEIDSPEIRSPFGLKSKQALSTMILHRTVTVRWKRRGRYRRIIGQVHIEGVWVNHELVAAGWARQFRRYSNCAVLSALEQQAIEGLKGMWAAPPPTELTKRDQLTPRTRHS
jgi:endonuclease YncB( thermonuclease family)